MEYGVVVNNKFALFDDEDEDPLAVLQQRQEEEAQKAKSKTAPKGNTNNAKVAAKNAKNVSQVSKTEAKQPAKVLTVVQDQKVKVPAKNQPLRRENVAEKPPRFRQNENAQRRPPRDSNIEPQRIESDFRPERSEPRGDDFHGRGLTRRGRGQGRGVANEGGFDRFGKREFERHSGSDRTGLKPVDKREGGGAHNWGTIADAVAEQEHLANNSSVQDQTTDGDTSIGPGDEPAVEGDAVEAEDEKQLTFDEWKALQDRDRAKPVFNIRKPGEGCASAPEWKKMYVLKKKPADDEQEEDEEYEEEDEDGRKQKQTVPIAIRFNDSESRGGPSRRGRGRGGASGPGRRQAGEGERSRWSDKAEVVPNVDNELDFPSLA